VLARAGLALSGSGWLGWCVWAGFSGVGLTEIAMVVVVGVGCRLYFENFTVDASIFVVSSF
jgi:hypothetical protein